jgi:hypothetical protein
VFLTNRHAGTLNWTEDSVSAMGHRDGRVVKSWLGWQTPG